MHDHFSELGYEWDGNVPRKKKRVLPDGTTVYFPYIADHAAYGFSPYFADGTPDYTSPHRPGYRFLDTDDAARAAADAAYAQMRSRLTDAWRRKDERPAAAKEAPPTRTLDELHALAEKAWDERNKRMQNAWRHRDGT
jgi:hypothetical protein